MAQNISKLLLFRVLDASINRASEGLRVLEDTQRLICGDSFLTCRLKSLRHSLTQAIESLDHSMLLLARDSQNDVGQHAQLDSEYDRGSIKDLTAANFSRVQQALRTIEEYGKTISADFAKDIEQIRFASYTLQKAVDRSQQQGHAFRAGSVCVLLDGDDDVSTFVKRVSPLIDAGTPLLQLRDKRLTDRELIDRGLALTEQTRGTDTQWIMNDRADLAVACNAHGVHLGQDDLPVATARAIVGPHRWIGVSTHNLQQARQAVLDGADYLGAGPTFASKTKSFEQFAGIDFLKEVSSEVSLPIFAIGGIAEANLDAVIAAGIRRVAVSSAVSYSSDPAAVVCRMMEALTVVTKT